MSGHLRALGEAGQAAWLDFVDRGFLASGGLRKLIAEDGVTGVTSNPAIFEKAMAHGESYDAAFAVFLANADAGPSAIYEALAIADIKAAAADLRPVYDRSAGRDGYVSFEVSPYLANDTAATVAEARRLWAAVAAPNLMVKVPGTAAGLSAIRTLIEDGININVTLLFAVATYSAVAEAYLAGLEARVAQGLAIGKVASVASFFISRIDGQVDAAIDARHQAGDPENAGLLALRGTVAIASAKLAYAAYQATIVSPRWQALAVRGAMPQRLLWASTGVKDPAYRDTLYVETLIGPDTVNTLPPATMTAFRDHGIAAATLGENVDAARRAIAECDRLGIKLDEIAARLVDDGVRQFSDAADALLAAIAEKRSALLGHRLNAMTAILPASLAEAVEKRLENARAAAWARRLWQGDAALWTGDHEEKWLGWLAAASGHKVDLDALRAFVVEAQRYTDVVLLGMGGSSLGPEVLARVLGSARGSPTLHVLDTTDPGQIATVVAAIDPSRTMVIVSSKSGSTMEPELLRAYFESIIGYDGSRYVAVTDPGSKLAATAEANGFGHIFLGDPAIGGRYSVLSAFGIVPTAAIGIDICRLYATTAPMVLSCGPDAPPAVNPALRLGAILGEAAIAGRNKLTIMASPALQPFGAWLEQLIAESTGKQGLGIIPVDLEPTGLPFVYGPDRLFIHMELNGDSDGGLVAAVTAIAAAGHPVIHIRLNTRDLIGQEFFRWEVATAIAGAVIGINPFDQPDVEDAKVATRSLIDAFELSDSLALSSPIASNMDFTLFGSPDAGPAMSDPLSTLRRHFTPLTPGDYVGILAYIERNDANASAIARIRAAVRDAKRAATVAGFGPRYLHSTGQVYKGGPPGGAFIIITSDTDPDIAVPGRRASFGIVQRLQAEGDMRTLIARGRSVLHVHLKSGGGGIDALSGAIDQALENE